MSSYVFQFFCGPEGIALANPGGTRARPALAAPPPRAELIFGDPGPRQAARLRSASASAEQEQPRRARDRDRRHHRHHRHHHRRARSASRHRRSVSGHRRRHRPRSRTPRQQPERPTASPPDRPPGQWQVPAQRPQLPTPTVPPGMFQATGSTAVPAQTSNASLSTLGNAMPHSRGPPPPQPERPQPPPRPNPCVQQQSPRGHERPRTPPKRAPAKPPRPLRHHEPNIAPPREPEPPAQVQATELVAKGQQPVETMFKDVMVASQSDLESQIEALLPGSDPGVHVKDGLTLFTQYVYFRLQYWYNKYPHRWPIANHECLQSIQARRSFTRKWMRSFSSLKEPEIDKCARFLLSRFQQMALPPCSIGRQEFFTLVHALLQSKLAHEDYVGEATYYASREKNVAVVQFELQDMPGPPVQSQNWYTWSHGTDMQGLIGILSFGRVLPTDAEVSGSAEGSFSFYGKAFDKPTWFEGLAEWVASLRHSTKNSSGCLVGGLIASSHVKSPSASTSHEGHMAKFHPLIHSASSDKRLAIRAVAARLDKLWVVSELLKTDFPPGEPSAARVKGPKRPLALADDNWGPWTNIGLADEQLETLLKTSTSGEPSAPSGLQARADA